VDFAAASVRVIEDAALLVLTTVPGDAVDAADPLDCLTPASWALALGDAAPSGSPLPLVRRVERAEEGTDPVLFRLQLDAPLGPAVPYTLAALGRGAYGMPTDSTPVAFTAPTVAGVVGQRPGEQAGDIALPVRADASGDLALVDRLAALRARMMLLVSVRRGAFTHAETFGRGVEPKRTLSIAKIGQEAAALRAELERDPDVRSADVRGQKIGSHAARFDLVVMPRFSPEPLRLSETIEAGGST
jgi:hypothetical protein